MATRTDLTHLTNWLIELTIPNPGRYEMAYRIYKDELKDWERRQTTINDIDDYIMRTTGAYWSTIERIQGVKERLQRLKEHMAPLSYAREQEVLERRRSKEGRL
jgi:hypothetical protein